MKDSDPGHEAAEGMRGQERLEIGRRRQDDPAGPEAAPRSEDEEQAGLQEIEAEDHLQQPAVAAFGHLRIVGGESEGAPPAAAPLGREGGIRVQPRGEELRLGASLEGGEDGVDGDDGWKVGALSDLVGAS